MTNWPAAGGTVRDLPTERNLRDIRKRGGELESRAFQSFLQLAVLGSHKLAFGSTEIEWAGGTEESKVTEVEHKLGKAPVTVLLTPAYSATSTFVFPEYQLNGEAKIRIKGFCPPAIKPGAGTKAVVSWIAIL